MRAQREVVTTSKLTEQEKVEIRNIFHKIYNNYGGPGYLEYLINSVSDDLHFVLLKEQGAVVATAALSINNSISGEVFFVAVDPEQRQRGLGREINQAAEDYAKHTLQLQVLYTGPLINFYELKSEQPTLNLGNLITTQKQGYRVAGFMLGQYIDFMHKPTEPSNAWLQNLSGCLMVKPLSHQESLQEKFWQECSNARAKLIDALTSESFIKNLDSGQSQLEKVIDMDGGLDTNGKPITIVSKLGYSRDIGAFASTLGTEEPFVPCGYCPSFKEMGETYYVGINIQQLVFLNSDNVWALDSQALSQILTEPDRVLLDLIRTYAGAILDWSNELH
jgi:hypothetical protein